MASRSLLFLLSLPALVAAAAAVLLWPTSAEPDASPRTPGPTPSVADSSVMLSEAESPRPATAPGVHPQAARSAERATVTPSFSGIVLDHERRPFDGARVSIYAVLGLDGALTELAFTQSREDGRFEIAVEGGWPERCMISAETKAAASLLRPLRPNEVVELVLGPPVLLTPCVLHGTVTDASTGQPLAGVSVTSGRDSSVVTDAMGRFELEAVGRNGHASISATCDGYRRDSGGADVTDGGRHEVSVSLQPLVELRVQVVDAVTRAPVPGARIGRRMGGFVATGPSGWCSLQVPERGSERFDVAAEGYVELHWYWQHTDTLPEIVRLRLPPAVSVTGTVATADGEPVTHAVVELYAGDERANVDLEMPEGLGRVTMGSGMGRALSDATGRFELRTCRTEEPFVVVAESDTHADCVPAHSAPIDPGVRADLDIGTLVLVQGGSISGVVERNGVPFRGMAVWYRSGGRIGAWSAISADGTFELAPVFPGRHEVCVIETGFAEPVARGVAVVGAGRTATLDIRFAEATSMISGRVTDERDRPWGGVGVQAASEDEGATWQAGAETDDQGRYEIVVRAAGRYDLRAHEESIRRLYRGVEPGARDIDFAAVATGRLRLRLVDAETGVPVFGGERAGDPIENVMRAASGVRWHKASEGAWWRSADLMPLGDGLADLELPVGRVDLEICLQHLGFRPTSRSCRVHAADTGSGRPLEMRLQRGIELQFVIEDLPGLRAAMGERRLFVVAEGQSIEGPLEPGTGNIWVGAHDYRASSPSIWHAQQLEPGGRNGMTLRGLAPGHYSVLMLPAGGIAFEPAGFAVDEATREIRLAWRRR